MVFEILHFVNTFWANRAFEPRLSVVNVGVLKEFPDALRKDAKALSIVFH